MFSLSNNDNISYNQNGGFLGFSISFIARLLISAFFIFMGIQASLNFTEYNNYIISTGIPYAHLVSVASILLQIIGGLLFTGILAIPNSVGWGKFFLLIFLALSIFNSLKMKGTSVNQIAETLKTLAILGGVLLA